MSPSNMELRIGAFLSLRLNDEANTAPIPPRSTSTVEGTKTKQTHPEPVSDVATGVAKGGASSGVPGFPSGFDVPSTPYKKQVQDYAKDHNLPQSWIDKISADPSRFERWLADHSMGKKYTKSNAGQVGNKNIQINHCQMNTPAVNNTKTIKLH